MKIFIGMKVPREEESANRELDDLQKFMPCLREHLRETELAVPSQDTDQKG